MIFFSQCESPAHNNAPSYTIMVRDMQNTTWDFVEGLFNRTTPYNSPAIGGKRGGKWAMEIQTKNKSWSSDWESKGYYWRIAKQTDAQGNVLLGLAGNYIKHYCANADKHTVTAIQMLQSLYGRSSTKHIAMFSIQIGSFMASSTAVWDPRQLSCLSTCYLITDQPVVTGTVLAKSHGKNCLW